MKDVIIVGSGPAGSLTGRRLAEGGYDVSILEEDPEVGNPVCCAGILGSKGLKREVGLDPSDWALNELEAGEFHVPDCDSLKLSRGQVEAFVIDRSHFDQDLATSAARAGAELRLNTRCLNVSRRGDRAILKANGPEGKEVLESRLVIGADGPNSVVARSLGMVKDPSPIVCAQAEVVSNADEKTTHVYLGNDLSEGFFGWVTPVSDFYRVGLGDTGGNVARRLRRFIDENEVLPDDASNRIVSFTTGSIPEPGSRKIYGDRVLLVGDAAGQVKPLTGGGLYLGLSSAALASGVAADSLEREPSEENLEDYSDLIEEKFGNEFEMGAKIRDIYRGMDDRDLCEFLEIVKTPEVKDLILKNANFDRHSELFEAFMKKGPSLLKSVGTKSALKYLRWLITS